MTLIHYEKADAGHLSLFCKRPPGFVQSGLDFIEGVEEPLRRYRGAHQQDAEDIPAEHVPPGCVRAFNSHPYGLCLQLFRNPGHPDKRIDERCRDS